MTVFIKKDSPFQMAQMWESVNCSPGLYWCSSHWMSAYLEIGLVTDTIGLKIRPITSHNLTFGLLEMENPSKVTVSRWSENLFADQQSMTVTNKFALSYSTQRQRWSLIGTLPTSLLFSTISAFSAKALIVRWLQGISVPAEWLLWIIWMLYRGHHQSDHSAGTLIPCNHLTIRIAENAEMVAVENVPIEFHLCIYHPWKWNAKLSENLGEVILILHGFQICDFMYYAKLKIFTHLSAPTFSKTMQKKVENGDKNDPLEIKLYIHIHT